MSRVCCPYWEAKRTPLITVRSTEFGTEYSICTRGSTLKLKRHLWDWKLGNPTDSVQGESHLAREGQLPFVCGQQESPLSCFVVIGGSGAARSGWSSAGCYEDRVQHRSFALNCTREGEKKLFAQRSAFLGPDGRAYPDILFCAPNTAFLSLIISEQPCSFNIQAYGCYSAQPGKFATTHRSSLLLHEHTPTPRTPSAIIVLVQAP